MAAKHHDYFAAGTQVVWDVDVLRSQVVRVYRATDPDSPKVYRRGELAEAEPAVPGWTMPVEDLFS
jgi:Uma2 family endonuclease